MTDFYLSNFQARLPAIRLAQQDSVDHLIDVHSHANPEMAERLSPLFRRYAVKPSLIGSRYSENLELAKAGKNILEKTRFFSERATAIVEEMYAETSLAPDHIIHVTCTGYVSPSAAQSIVTHKQWQETTGVTHAYHMGCYASLPAIRLAKGLVADGQKNVDIVHTEMCSLHLERTDHTPEQIVVQSLFADGHIKYTGGSEAPTKGFRVLAIQELIIPDSKLDMSWISADFGMKMTLSRDVPAKISEHLREFLLRMCRHANLDLSTTLRDSIFAVHPGGPKIIDSVKEGLELSDAQVAASREVLFERGNMSSATLPHVWMKLLDSELQKGQKIISFAFGPGLTIFGAIFESL